MALFTTLSIDAQRNVLRQSSTRPYRDDWGSFIPADALQALLYAIPNATKRTFRTVRNFACETEFHGCCSCLSTGLKQRILGGGSHEPSVVTESFFPHLFPGAIHIGISTFDFKQGYNTLIPPVIEKHCDALRQLVICSDIDYCDDFDAMYLSKVRHLWQMLNARGNQLNTLLLPLLEPRLSSVVASTCTNLRHLGLSFPDSVPEKAKTSSLIRILPAIGKQLVKLEIWAEITEDGILTIHRYCPSLQVFNLYYRRSVWHHREHANVLVSYGAQLREANLNCFNPQLVKLVANNCPNVAITVTAHDEVVLSSLRTHRAKVRIACPIYPGYLLRMLEECTQLHSLIFDDGGFRNIGFNELQQQVNYYKFGPSALTTLCYVTSSGLRRGEAMLFASCTGELRCLEVSVRLANFLVLNELQNLVHCNPHLTHVRVVQDVTIHREEVVAAAENVAGDDVRLRGTPQVNETELALCRLLRIFSKCSELRELVVAPPHSYSAEKKRVWKYDSAIRQVVSDIFRFRRVHVNVFGADFAPSSGSSSVRDTCSTVRRLPMTDFNEMQDGVYYGTTFAVLRESAGNTWRAYVDHLFVQQLALGKLEHDCYLGYLRQDYIFLKHFARAWALLVVKLDDLELMRKASNTLTGIMDEEIPGHVRECSVMGIDEDELKSTKEGVANVAYTRFVIDAGLSGDALDLLVALVPCVLGYGEIGAMMSEVDLKSHPYKRWIREYSCDVYQSICKEVGGLLDTLVAKLIGENVEPSPRWEKLKATFITATRMEVGFWDMSLARK